MTASVTDASDFSASLGCLVSPSLGALAAQLSRVTGLNERERALLRDTTQATLVSVLHGKLTRLLLLELNAARVRGVLRGETGPDRWKEFAALSSQRAFWDALQPEYPDLLARIERIVENRCRHTLQFAQRFAEDREALAALCTAPVGELQAVTFGAGDSHQNGQTVVLLRCEGGRLVYKPRSLAIDAALRGFVQGVLQAHGAPSAIGVPRVIDRGSHGWCEFVEHRHANGAAELASFYRGIGHWLAIMRLVSGSDLHAENLIAQGPRPVVVDCETLFTPRLKVIPSGLGEALDRAVQLVSSTVLNSGLLPARGSGLGWRGVDGSGLGALPNQQPKVQQLDIVNAGSDQARIGQVQVDAPSSQNHPSPNPVLSDYWPEVLAGFDELSTTLRAMDAQAQLEPLLLPFHGCRVRVVTRATEVYAEVGRMLWHPVSLHKPGEAVERARQLLGRMAARVRLAPGVPEVIDAEIADLLDGDVPFFTTMASHGALQGPRGTTWLRPANLVMEALDNWRQADFDLERRVIRATLVSAYINDGWMPPEVLLKPSKLETADLDARRRRQAATIMRELVDSRIEGDDGTVTWIAPILNPAGWSVQPLEQDLYGGASGIALLVAAYLAETKAGRADPVEGVERLLPQLLKTLHCAEEQRDRQRLEIKKPRPGSPGSYIGLGSQIWTWLTLAHWGVEPGRAIERACTIATHHLPAAIEADDVHDLLIGKAGAIVPLLKLAHMSGQRAYLEMAVRVGDRLAADAVRVQDGRAVHWRHPRWPEGLGGYAHGASGIGWALRKLHQASGEQRFAELSQAAFAFEAALFDEQEQNWLDLRLIEGVRTAAAWCHGAVGIGLALTDLHPALDDEHVRRQVRCAAAAAWRMGLGWNHSLCHGDLGVFELQQIALRAGLAPEGLTQERLLAHMVASMEEHGATCGITRDTFSPGLLPGLGGVAYQLLRAHPQSPLPSVLVLDGGGP